VANASPYARGRREEREAMLRERALETNCPIAYVNLVGGQDELVYDGQSVVVNAQGDVIARAPAFSEELLVCDIDARASTQGVPLTIGYARDDERLTALHVNRIAEPLSETHSISVNVDFPQLAGGFPPASPHCTTAQKSSRRSTPPMSFPMPFLW